MIERIEGSAGQGKFVARGLLAILVNNQDPWLVCGDRDDNGGQVDHHVGWIGGH